MLDRPRGQDSELTTITVLRGMRASIVLDMHGSMAMTMVERICVLEGVAIWILQSQILVEHRVIVVEPIEVESSLRCESMMS